MLFIPGRVDGQDTTSISSNSVIVGYYGNNLWNPGLKAGFERQYRDSFYLLAAAGFYVDPGSHTGVFLQGGVDFRWEGKSGWNISADLQPAGIYRSFLPGTYEFRDDRFERISVPGNFYYAPSTGLSLGSEVDHHRVSAWYSRFSVTLLTGYNFYIMPLVGVEAGIRIKGGGEK